MSRGKIDGMIIWSKALSELYNDYRKDQEISPFVLGWYCNIMRSNIISHINRMGHYKVIYNIIW